MEPRQLKQVQKLHDLGLDLIPLRGKRPIENEWVSQERKSWDQLSEALEELDANAGVRLGTPLSDGRYLAVLDVDVVGPLTDAAEQQNLDQALKAILGGTKCPTVISGFTPESRHIYLATTERPPTRTLAQSATRVEYTKGGSTKQGPLWTVQLRGHGSQVVVPPSIHPDTSKRYKWANGVSPPMKSLEALPELPLDALLKPPQAPPVAGGAGAMVRSLPIAAQYQELILYGDQGSVYPSRSEALFAALCVLTRDTALTDTAITGMLLDEDCAIGAKAREKPAPARWLTQQIKQARDRIAEQKRTAQATEERQRTLINDDPVYKSVCERHSLVLLGGKPAVFRKRIDPPSHESQYDVLTIGALKELYANKRITVEGRRVNPVDLWRVSPDRREHLEGVSLIPPPEICPSGVFNLWQGFSVDPVLGADVAPWVEFCTEVIAAGNEAHAAWLLDWCADLFQSPGTPPGTSIVLRGGEGVGKGTFASALGHIVGPHFRHVVQESQLTGRFNAHFADSLLIFADELIYGGDKKHRGTLYALVTERFFMMERKNFDAVPMRNLNRMVVASNNDWVVPAGVDARRWFVLDVSDVYRGNQKYFRKLRSWFEKGGYAKLLGYLLERSIANDLRKAPITQGLIDQKLSGMDAMDSWWLDCLEQQSVLEPVGDAPPVWDEFVSKRRMYQSYTTWCKDHGAKVFNRVHFFRRLYVLQPGISSVRRTVDDERELFLKMPSLETCKKHSTEKLGQVL